MAPGKTYGEITQLVAQVGPLVNEGVARMDIIRAQVDEAQAKKP